MSTSTLQVKDAIYENGAYYVHGFKSYRAGAGWSVMLARKGKTPSATKCISSRTFQDKEEAAVHFNAMREQVDFLVNQEAQKREAKKANRANAIAIYKAGIPHPWKEGDLCHTSWGYEQTNVEAFQVVEVPSRTKIVVRRIGGENKETGFLQGDFIPRKNRLIGEPITCTAGFCFNCDGTVYESWQVKEHSNYGHTPYPTKEGETHHWTAYA